MFDATAALQRQSHLRGSKKFKRYSPYDEPETLAVALGKQTLASAKQTPDDKTAAQRLQRHHQHKHHHHHHHHQHHQHNTTNGSAMSQDDEAKSSPDSFESASPSTRSDLSSPDPLSLFLASEPSSPDSYSLFLASEPTSPIGRKRQSPDSSLETSASELTPPTKIPSKTTQNYATSNTSNTRSSSSNASEEAQTTARRSSFAHGSSNYFDDERVFLNLILRERGEPSFCRVGENSGLSSASKSTVTNGQAGQLSELTGELRRSILAWILKICEHQMCQDEIFPLATMILEKFLKLNPISRANYFFCLERSAASADFDGQPSVACAFDYLEQPTRLPDERLVYLECADEEANELARRQLCLFAACSLLLATKMRQTPRLCLQTLIDFSRLELALELTREEILDGELLVLTALKWDLAALVTPSDFVQILARKCQNVLANFLHPTQKSNQQRDDNNHDAPTNARAQSEPDANECRCMQEAASAQRHQLKRDHQQQRQFKHQQQQHQQDKLINRCEESRVRRHTQTLLELCLMDSHISQYSASVLAMASMAVAIDGLSMAERSPFRLNEIVTQIHESTNKVNELQHMIDAAFQIEKYVQKLLYNSTNDD